MLIPQQMCCSNGKFDGLHVSRGNSYYGCRIDNWEIQFAVALFEFDVLTIHGAGHERSTILDAEICPRKEIGIVRTDRGEK